MSRCRKFVVFWRKHFLGVELALALVAAAAFFLWGEYWGGRAELQDLLHDRRSAVYGAFAAIAGSLLGFVLATASIVLGLSSSPRLKRVRESAAYRDLWKVFTSATKALGLATAVLLGALIFDRDASPKFWLLYLSAFTVAFAAIRLIRCIWVLEQVIDVVASEGRSRRPL